MKKIVIISPRLEKAFSGGEIYIVSLARHLSRKYEVHIITKPSTTKHPNLDNITIHYIEGIGSGELNILKAIPALKQKLEEINPDIVHLHCFMSMMLYSIIIESGKYKLITTVHSTPDGKTRLFSWFDGIENQKSFLKLLYEKTKCNVTLFGSSYYMDEYTSNVPVIKNISKCYVNPYYSDIEGISIKERLKLDDHLKKDNTVRILFPSRIVKRKGIEETLELLKILPNNYILELPAMPQKEYQNYNDVILKKIEELNLKDRVVYPNNVVIGKEMYDYYKRADITIIPSYFEGFGIVAVEALDTCCPVVSTCTGGLNEIIIDNYNGVKIYLNNLEDAKNKIIKLIEDKKFRNMIIENGKNFVNEKYSKKRHMDLIDNIYNDLLSGVKYVKK